MKVSLAFPIGNTVKTANRLYIVFYPRLVLLPIFFYIAKKLTSAEFPQKDMLIPISGNKKTNLVVGLWGGKNKAMLQKVLRLPECNGIQIFDNPC